MVVRVHANLGNSENADQTEDDIITRFTDILSGKSQDEVSRILEEIQVKVIAAKKGQSVILYFYCTKASDLTDLCEINWSGKLGRDIQRLFSQLFLNPTSSEDDELHYRSQMKRLTYSTNDRIQEMQIVFF